MKKTLSFIGIVIFTFLFFGINNVDAKTCSNIYAAPHLYQVSPDVRSGTYNLTTSYNQCLGSNTEVWFSSIKSMPDSWYFSSGTLWINLWEEDPAGNDDEHVKEYIGSITNKTITNIYLNRTITPGAIDSAGDQTCELYLKFGSSGKYGLTIEKSLFNYQVCMK